MKRFPLVSILTSSYNQGRFIEDTILSVQGQDYPNIEHIIIDGGSTDNTLNILQKYGDRIIWISEKDKGQADAYNKGLKIAKGEIIGMLNSDDFYVDRGVVSYVVNLFQTNESIDVIYGDAVWVDQNNKVLKVYLRPKFSHNRLKRFDFIPHPSAFIKRNSIPTPLFRDDLNFAMDYDLWLRMMENGCKFMHIDRIISAMRHHSLAKSVKHKLEMWKEGDVLRNKFNDYNSFVYQLNKIIDLLLLLSLKFKGLKVFYSLEKIINPPIQILFPDKLERFIYQLNFKGTSSPFSIFKYLFGSHK